MAQVIRKDAPYPRPEPQPVQKTGLRGGGPTMQVPGDGNVRKAVELPGDRGERSVVRDADAMAHVGGVATEHERGK